MNENTIEIHTKKGQHFRLSEQQAHGSTRSRSYFVCTVLKLFITFIAIEPSFLTSWLHISYGLAPDIYIILPFPLIYEREVLMLKSAIRSTHPRAKWNAQRGTAGKSQVRCQVASQVSSVFPSTPREFTNYPHASILWLYTDARLVSDSKKSL
jgi:hypothetical protein